MALRNLRDLVHVRWRSGQLLLAAEQGKLDEAGALARAMRAEGIDDADRTDEIRLLLRQFGHRPAWALAQDVTRCWMRLRQMCTRCGRTSRWRDNDGVCHRCVLAEVDE